MTTEREIERSKKYLWELDDIVISKTDDDKQSINKLNNSSIKSKNDKKGHKEDNK